MQPPFLWVNIMYKIDLLRQIEANTRGGSVSDCYSKYDLWRMIERNTRSKPNPPYQLDNGNWDMSNRELVSFSRSTKAWLDGVEYAPNEPRYTNDGELLVEPQSTATFSCVDVNSKDFGYEYKPLIFDGGWNKFECMRTAPLWQGWATMIFAQQQLPLTMSFKLKKDRKGDVFFGFDKIKTIEIRESDTPKTNQAMVDCGDYYLVSHYFDGDSIARFCIGYHNQVVGSYCYISTIQTETANIATSYIPTTTTAVTRAADIATVRDTEYPKYQLDSGTWDMSNRELVSFSRSTKAWLDGKEYAPDEPRYTAGGELLVEGQATNYALNSNAEASEYSGGFKGSDIVDAGNFNGIKMAKYVTNNGSSGYGYGVYTPVTVGNLKTNKTVTLSFLINKKATRLGVYLSGFTIGWEHFYDENAGGELTYKVIDADHYFVSIKRVTDKVINGMLQLFISNGESVGGFTLSCEDVNYYSLIPTTNTAVTRAADIAIVRDTQ